MRMSDSEESGATTGQGAQAEHGGGSAAYERGLEAGRKKGHDDAYEVGVAAGRAAHEATDGAEQRMADDAGADKAAGMAEEKDIRDADDYGEGYDAGYQKGATEGYHEGYSDGWRGETKKGRGD
jgi:hypothetical protein